MDITHVWWYINQYKQQEKDSTYNIHTSNYRNISRRKNYFQLQLPEEGASVGLQRESLHRPHSLG